MKRPETHMSKILKQLSLATFLGLSVSACQTVTDYSGAADLKRATVSSYRFKHVITLNEQDQFDDSAKETLLTFLAAQNIGYGDTLSLDFGEQKPQADIYLFLEQHGLSVSHVPTVWGVAPTAGQVHLVVDRYTVNNPQCVTYPDPVTPDFQNVESAHFGCSAQSILATMVANPQHMVKSAGSTNANAEQATAAINGQRSSRGSNGISSGDVSGSVGLSLSAPLNLPSKGSN